MPIYAVRYTQNAIDEFETAVVLPTGKYYFDMMRKMDRTDVVNTNNCAFLQTILCCGASLSFKFPYAMATFLMSVLSAMQLYRSTQDYYTAPEVQIVRQIDEPIDSQRIIGYFPDESQIIFNEPGSERLMSLNPQKPPMPKKNVQYQLLILWNGIATALSNGYSSNVFLPCMNSLSYFFPKKIPFDKIADHYFDPSFPATLQFNKNTDFFSSSQGRVVFVVTDQLIVAGELKPNHDSPMRCYTNFSSALDYFAEMRITAAARARMAPAPTS